MNLKGAFLKLLVKPKIVHSLPGRVRIQVALIRRIPADKKNLVDHILSLLAMPAVIHTAEANLTSGNLLIQYDHERVTEKDILEFLKNAIRLFLKYQDRVESLSPERIPVLTERLKAYMQEAIHPPLTLSKDLDIPDHVLA